MYILHINKEYFACCPLYRRLGPRDTALGLPLACDSSKSFVRVFHGANFLTIDVRKYL